MGADLIASWTAWPHDKDGNDIPVDRLRERILTDIAAISDDALGHLYELECGDDPYQVEEQEGAEAAAESFDDWRSDMRKRLVQAVKDVLELDARGLIEFEVRGVHVIFCGGTSWGDDPNDEFRSMVLLNEANLFYDEETT